PPVARGRRRGVRTHWSARAPEQLPFHRPPVHRGRGRLRRRTPPRRGPGPRGRPPRQVPRLPERGGGPARGTAHTARFGPYTDAPRPEGAPPLDRGQPAPRAARAAPAGQRLGEARPSSPGRRPLEWTGWRTRRTGRSTPGTGRIPTGRSASPRRSAGPRSTSPPQSISPAPRGWRADRTPGVPSRPRTRRSDTAPPILIRRWPPRSLP